VTPAAEFNIWADPEAAARVFASRIDLTMVGLDVTHKALFTRTHEQHLEGRVGELVRALLEVYGEFHRRQYGWEGSPIHDAVAVAHVARPDLLETFDRGVKIDTGPELSRGRTHVDVWGRTAWERNAHVAVDIRAADFLDLLVQRLNSLS
jgi:purine nucleosidase